MVIQAPTNGIQAAIVAGWEQVEFAGIGSMVDYRTHAARQIPDDRRNIQKSPHNHGDLNKIENRHREHAAERRIQSEQSLRRSRFRPTG